MNEHLTLEDFGRIFSIYEAKYMFEKWIRCNKLEFLFRQFLATNEVLAWDRAITGYYKNINVVKSFHNN